MLHIEILIFNGGHLSKGVNNKNIWKYLEYLENIGEGDSFLNGIQLGAALITMFWVSMVVIVLDGYAMYKALDFALQMKKKYVVHLVLNGIALAITMHFFLDFFSSSGRGLDNGEKFHLSDFFANSLHALFGNDNTAM